MINCDFLSPSGLPEGGIQRHFLSSQNWGLLPYTEALKRQEGLVEEVLNHSINETIVFCSHPPVVTRGRTTPESDIFAWNGDVCETNRGGRATYHGPNQLIIYPIIDLRVENRSGLPARHISNYICVLGKAVAASLQELGVQAELRQGKESDENGVARHLTGIWYQDQKVASIGVAVRKWIAYHGIAINVDQDRLAFTGIRPCGFQTETMISLEEILGRTVSREDLQKLFLKNLNIFLGF